MLGRVRWPGFFPLTLMVVLLAVLEGSAAGAVQLPLGLGAPVPASALNAPPCLAPSHVLELAVWRVTTADNRPDLSCDNAFVEYQRTPRSEQTPQDAFDKIAEQVRNARAEVLLATMEWHAGQGHPGWTFAQAVRDLYAKVQANPPAYPSGMTIRVVLGGFPDLSRPDGGTYALNIVRDLRLLGVPLTNPNLGWKVAILNYPFFPHSHTKLHVIDGQDLSVAGYNFTDWHLPSNEPGGHALRDLGLRMRGPIAQDGVAVFDDLWRHSRQVRCPPGVAPTEVYARCALNAPDPVTHPQVAREAVSAGTQRAFLLYRRPGYDMADLAFQSLFMSSVRQIDLMQADFSPELSCWLAYLQPAGCGRDTFPVYLAALLDAMERGVKVRVLTVNYGYGAVANRSGIALMRYEARLRGLDKLFEARYVQFQMHTKALTVDHGMVVVGSMNFHFSAWGPLGLNEAALATSDPQAIAEQETSFEEIWNHQSVAVPEESWLKYMRP